MTREYAIEHCEEYVEVDKLGARDLVSFLNKIYDDFENRTCESCRYVGYVKTDGTSYCSDNNTVYKDPVKEKFCCNRYEAKENK